MTAPVFVDSNVLIYAVDEGDLKKHVAARLWYSELWKNRCGRVSFQVLQEFYVNATRKMPTAIEAIRAEIKSLLAWQPTAINGEILDGGWRIRDRYHISFWDALIVSAAKAASCRHLLTEDLQAGQEFEGVLVVNPFRSSPDQFVE